MPHRRTFAAAVAITLLAASLSVPVLAQDEAPAPPEATPNPVPMEVPSGDGTAVRLTTDEGDIVIGLYNESAPVAAENFLNLAESGYYDDVGFHRAVPGFVLQGGDPEGTGGGGPGYGIADEEVVGEYGRGIVAMARTPAPNSQGSQFFFVLDDAAGGALESARTYAIFGRVLEGMDVVDRIVESRPASDLIEDPVRIISASVEQAELPPEPSPPPPSASELAGDALTASLPAEVAGSALESGTFTAEQILEDNAEVEAIAELTSAADAVGASTDDLALISAGIPDDGERHAVVLGVTMPGVAGESVTGPLTTLFIGDTSEFDVTGETVADRDVTTLRPTADSGDRETVYRVVSGETVYFVVADADSRDELIAALP
jgi:cyclophilin family peptidyl-prolyl cis-trans isomerase